MTRLALVVMLIPLAAPAQVSWPQREWGDDSMGGSAARSGNQLSPQLASLPNGNLFLVWRDNSAQEDWSDILGAVIDPADAGAAAPFPIANGNLADFAPDLACSAQTCFVVWGDYATYNESAIWLQRFDLDGLKLGPPQLLSPPASGRRFYPSVAFASTGQHALVVWQEGQELPFVLLDAAGAVLLEGASVTSTPGIANYRPRAASSSAGFAVAWTHEGPLGWELRTASVSNSGTVIQNGTVITNRNGSQVPAVVAAGDQMVLLSLEIDGTSYGRLYAWSVDQYGAVDGGPGPDGGPLEIATGGHYGRPTAVYDALGWTVVSAQQSGSSDELRAYRVGRGAVSAALVGQQPPEAEVGGDVADSTVAMTPPIGGSSWVVWSDDRSDTDYDLYLARVDLTDFSMTPAAGIRLFRSAPSQRQPAVSAASDGFVAVWVETDTPNERKLRGVRIGRDGQVVGPPVVVGTAGHPVAAPALAPVGDDHVLTWVDHLPNWKEWKVARLRAGAVVPGSEQRFWASQHAEPSAPVAVETRGDTWLMVDGEPSGSGARSLYAVRARRDGSWADAAPVKIDTGGDEVGPLSAAASAQQLYVAWVKNSVISGTRLSFSGVSKNDHKAGPITSDGYPEQTSVASDGADFLVVWGGLDNGAETVHGVVVSGATGQPVSPVRKYLDAPFNELMGQPLRMRPRAAWDGSRYLVVFDVHRRVTGSDVYFLALDATGAELERGAVAASDDQEYQAAVATDGRGRTLSAFVSFVPDAGATRVFGRSHARVLEGATCLTPAECLEGVCGTSGCCEVATGAGCFTPDLPPAPDPGPVNPDGPGAPWRLKVACGCGSTPGPVAVALLALAFRRRRPLV